MNIHLIRFLSAEEIKKRIIELENIDHLSVDELSELQALHHRLKELGI